MKKVASIKCPECGYETSPARVLKKQGKALVHTGFVIACKHIDCDWQSEEMLKSTGRNSKKESL